MRRVIQSESIRAATATSSGTLAELMQDPRERILRAVLLLALTFTAGWTDALTYVGLGHVFASFMTGNILFFGLSAVHGERALLLRAGVALLLFLAGSALGALLLGRVPPRQTRRVWHGAVARCLLLEWLILLGFAIAWRLTGDLGAKGGVQIALLGVAAFAMGPQGALVEALNIPGVVADALTGTVLQLGKRVAQRIDRKEPSHPLSAWFLTALCLTYFAAAVAVTLTVSWWGRPFVPAIAVAAVIVAVLASRETAGSDAPTAALKLKERAD